MNVCTGDTVKVWKFVLDTEYEAEGVVERITPDGYILVRGDYYSTENTATSRCEILRVAESATEKQVAYLRALGWNGNADTLRKSDASDLIDEYKAWRGAVGTCHYCGGPAIDFGFFGEPICRECGGRA